MNDLTANEIDALLDALRESTPTPEGAFTTEELAARWQCTVETARKRMKPLLRAGKIEHLKVPRLRMDKVTQRVNAYRIVA